MVQRTSFQKLQRERNKKAKAERKREQRLAEASAPEPAELPEEGDIPPEQLLVLVEQLHEDFEAKRISFEEFEERKAELMARLVV